MKWLGYLIFSVIMVTLGLVSNAYSQGLCYNFDALVRELETKHGETFRFQIGLSSKGFLVEVFIDIDDGSYTIVAKHPDKRGCILDVGKHNGVHIPEPKPSIRYIPVHEWYRGLRSPRSNNCCNDRDCRPVPYRSSPGSSEHEIFINGAWMRVPHDAIVGMFSPDGQTHACWSGSGASPYIRCVILPGMGV